MSNESIRSQGELILEHRDFKDFDNEVEPMLTSSQHTESYFYLWG